MRDAADTRDRVAVIAVVADDLTGAADTGAAFAGAGLSTLVTWGADGLAAAMRRADALAIDAGTRALDADTAAATTRGIARALRSGDVAAIYKKADSLLRGHIGEETAAVLEGWGQQSVAIAAFAFPDVGRTTIQGRQCAAELEGGREIVPLFEKAGLAACAIDLAEVRGERLDARMQEGADRGAVIVCDAATNADLERVARAGQRLRAPVIWVGTGGLARALAPSIGRRADRAHAIDRAARRGPLIIVCGSASRVAREQIARVVAAGTTPIEVPAALHAPATAAALVGAADEIRRSLDRGADIVVFPPAPSGGIDPHVSRAVADLVSPVAMRVGGAALTGGDTATAVLRAWGMTGLRIVDEIEPGMPMSISEGAHRMPVVTKAGAFGSPDALVRAKAALHAMQELGQGIG